MEYFYLGGTQVGSADSINSFGLSGYFLDRDTFLAYTSKPFLAQGGQEYLGTKDMDLRTPPSLLICAICCIYKK